MSDFYDANILLISQTLKISIMAASYMYNRAKRSKKSGEKYMYFNTRLQNAIVLADSKIDNWEDIKFDTEEKQLDELGIQLDTMSDTPINAMTDNTSLEDSEWTTVKKKPVKSKNMKYLEQIGIRLTC